MNNIINSAAESHLRKLSKILNYELASSILLVLSWISVLAMPLMILAAIMFIPYLIFVLTILKKWGWISGLLVFVFVPLIGVVFLASGSEYLNYFLLIPMTMFYLYCFLIKNSVREWLHSIEEKKRYQQEKTKREVENKIFNDILNGKIEI